MDTLMSNRDWLHIYKSAIKDQQIDMDHLIRQNRHSENYLDDMQNGNS